jgi:hypothetical protein
MDQSGVQDIHGATLVIQSQDELREQVVLTIWHAEPVNMLETRAHGISSSSRFTALTNELSNADWSNYCTNGMLRQ